VEFGNAPHYEQVQGMHIYRVPVSHGDDFFHWVVNMNESMGHKGGEIVQQVGHFDLIHAHDWLVADAAIALKHLFKLPLIATIHATEHGRHNGIYHDGQRYIHQKEGELVYNAWRVIVCSQYMQREVCHSFQAPTDKIDVIYNGIVWEKKRPKPHFDYPTFRRRFAADDEKIVYYLGRMTHEKGVSVLLDAAPKVLAAMAQQVKFVIIGGGHTDHLKKQAWDLGIWHKCFFTGFMPETELDHFQVIADCAVFPSLYEPFGIVVLESFAARVPVVVSDTCGLPEVVQHTKTGVVTQTNNPDSLAWGILEVLQNSDYAQWLVDNAYEDLSYRFSWPHLATLTQRCYQRVMRERSQIHW
jgi:glycosyltransferase involved in cell wall biosynthesis